MKMDLKDHNVAKIIMVIMIVVGAIMGNGNSLNKEKSKVEDYFFYGDEGICIANDLNDMASEVDNLIVIANKYDIDRGLIDIASKNTKALRNSTSVDEKFDLKEEMVANMNELYYALLDEDLSDNHQKLVKGAYVDFNSSANIITHDSYNEMATEYNSLLDSFPSSILRVIHRAKEVALFQ